MVTGTESMGAVTLLRHSSVCVMLDAPPSEDADRNLSVSPPVPVQAPAPAHAGRVAAVLQGGEHGKGLASDGDRGQGERRMYILRPDSDEGSEEDVSPSCHDERSSASSANAPAGHDERSSGASGSWRDLPRSAAQSYAEHTLIIYILFTHLRPVTASIHAPQLQASNRSATASGYIRRFTLTCELAPRTAGEGVAHRSRTACTRPRRVVVRGVAPGEAVAAWDERARRVRGSAAAEPAARAAPTQREVQKRRPSARNASAYYLVHRRLGGAQSPTPASPAHCHGHFPAREHWLAPVIVTKDHGCNTVGRVPSPVRFRAATSSIIGTLRLKSTHKLASRIAHMLAQMGTGQGGLTLHEWCQGAVSQPLILHCFAAVPRKPALVAAAVQIGGVIGRVPELERPEGDTQHVTR